MSAEWNMMSLKWEQKRKVCLLKTYFFNRIDVVGLNLGTNPFPGRPLDLDHLLAAHVAGSTVPPAPITIRNSGKSAKGRYRVGSYAPEPPDRTKWLCIDVDGAGHATPVRNPEGTAVSILEKAKKLGRGEVKLGH